MRPFELLHLKANGVENLSTDSNMGIFWGYSNYITSDLTPRKESIMSADHDLEVLLARTVDTHGCTHNVALGAAGIHPTLYVEQPRLIAVLTY